MSRPPRRERSALESLLSIALALEAVLVFFVTLTAFGLKALDPVPAFVGGAVLIILLVLTGRLVMYPWGVWLAWALQVVLVATGFLIPIMFFIGAGFAGLFIFCFVKGRQLDRAKAEYRLTHPEELA